MTSSISAWLDRLLAVRRRTRRRPHPLLIVGVLAALAAGLVLAIPELDVTFSDVQLLPLVLLAVIGVPASTAGNALEYRVLAHVVGRPTTWATALRIAVVGTAANLLPVPGAVAVRIRELRVEGSAWSGATFVTAALGVIWVAESLVATAVVLLLNDDALMALGAAVAGGLTGLMGVALLRRGMDDRAGLGDALMRMLVVETFLLTTTVARMMLVLVALDVDEPLPGAIGLALSGALASAVGLFPAGLGLREALAAVISPIVGLAAAVGFTATVLNRVIGLAMYFPLSLLLLRRPSAPASDAPEPVQQGDADADPTAPAG